MSETEKSDKKFIDWGTKVGALGLVVICIFHMYNFFMLLVVGMATDSLSTKGKAAMFEVLWMMIKCEYCYWIWNHRCFMFSFQFKSTSIYGH